ncbi:MAG: aconitase/3-isopropylmalate dehydratase large subunit family protein [bacterium]
MGKTFVEKIFNAPAGSIVFHQPDIVLSHDNTASIAKTFSQMGGQNIKYPDRLLVVLDHNAPPTTTKLANDYQFIKNFVKQQGIGKFHGEGEGICHQVMSYYAKPGMVIVGSDSHTSTAGAFNAFATGIDRTETAGIWLKGETWFRVPESIKIVLEGKLSPGVYSKDLALWIIGMISSSGANYQSVEFHGPGMETLTISDRMVLANLSAEMGAKNAVFPNDDILQDFLQQDIKGTWSDPDAHYDQEIKINLADVFPVVSAPHHVDNVKAVDQVKGTLINQAVIGTCTNGRIEDLRIAAEILKDQQVDPDVLMVIIPASRKIFQQAAREGLLEIFSQAGATVMVPSCGPCLGTGQALPADNWNVISTANRNFLGRMGNPQASIFLASPATVARSAVKGKITPPPGTENQNSFPHTPPQSETVNIQSGDDRYNQGIWDYSDVDNLNTDQMFAGSLTYTIKSSEPETIIPHLFMGLDGSFASRLKSGDIILGGENFGCGSSREHPSVGLAHAGVKAVIVKSVARIFYRSAINQGLLVIVAPQAVQAYKPGIGIDIDPLKGKITVGDQTIQIPPLPDKLKQIIDAGGLKKLLKNSGN